MQVMGDESSVCNHLQAPAASRATLVPSVKPVLQVGRISYHHMNQGIALCLEGVMDSSDGWWCQLVPSTAGASGLAGETGTTGQTGVTGGWTLTPMHEAFFSLVPWRCHGYK